MNIPTRCVSGERAVLMSAPHNVQPLEAHKLRICLDSVLQLKVGLSVAILPKSGS